MRGACSAPQVSERPYQEQVSQRPVEDGFLQIVKPRPQLGRSRLSCLRRENGAKGGNRVCLQGGGASARASGQP